jgi:hypothetical protein
MHPTITPQCPRAPRRDGWTAERRRQFLDHLVAGLDVRRACARVGISRESAYRLRRREAAFARAWDETLHAARAADERRFSALMAERPWALSTLSGECKLHGAGRRLGTVSQPSEACELGSDARAAKDRATFVRNV